MTDLATEWEWDALSAAALDAYRLARREEAVHLWRRADALARDFPEGDPRRAATRNNSALVLLIEQDHDGRRRRPVVGARFLGRCAGVDARHGGRRRGSQFALSPAHGAAPCRGLRRRPACAAPRVPGWCGGPDPLQPRGCPAFPGRRRNRRCPARDRPRRTRAGVRTEQFGSHRTLRGCCRVGPMPPGTTPVWPCTMPGSGPLPGTAHMMCSTLGAGNSRRR